MTWYTKIVTLFRIILHNKIKKVVLYRKKKRYDKVFKEKIAKSHLDKGRTLTGLAK